MTKRLVDEYLAVGGIITVLPYGARTIDEMDIYKEMRKRWRNKEFWQHYNRDWAKLNHHNRDFARSIRT